MIPPTNKRRTRKDLNKSITIKSIVKADNVITFTRTSLLKQGMTPKNIDIIQKEWIITVKNYLMKDLDNDLRGIYFTHGRNKRVLSLSLSTTQSRTNNYPWY